MKRYILDAFSRKVLSSGVSSGTDSMALPLFMGPLRHGAVVADTSSTAMCPHRSQRLEHLLGRVCFAHEGVCTGGERGLTRLWLPAQHNDLQIWIHSMQARQCHPSSCAEQAP